MSSPNSIEVSPEIKKALDKTKAHLMSRADSAFFTTVYFSLKQIWTKDIPTAATNGTQVMINPDFFMKLDLEERVFLLIHEAMHVAYLHMGRLMDREPRKWNIAGDHVINLQLIKRNFKMPKGGLADQKYQGLSTEEVYKLLPEDASEDFTLDLLPPDQPLDELEREVEDILVRASIQSKAQDDRPGTIPEDIQIYLNKLLNPKLPWQRILQKYIQNLSKNDYTFKKPNRRFFPNHYLPSLNSTKLMDIAIAVDASGSVTDEEFKVFVSETNGIMKMMQPDKITLIQFTSHIKSVDTIKSIKDLASVQFKGRGGTKIEPVLEWANENKPQLLLVFTDGEFKFRGIETKVNTLWLIHNNEGFKAPFGKIIHYDI